MQFFKCLPSGRGKGSWRVVQVGDGLWKKVMICLLVLILNELNQRPDGRVLTGSDMRVMDRPTILLAI